jgi:hypothetical protein
MSVVTFLRCDRATAQPRPPGLFPPDAGCARVQLWTMRAGARVAQRAAARAVERLAGDDGGGVPPAARRTGHRRGGERGDRPTPEAVRRHLPARVRGRRMHRMRTRTRPGRGHGELRPLDLGPPPAPHAALPCARPALVRVGIATDFYPTIFRPRQCGRSADRCLASRSGPLTFAAPERTTDMRCSTRGHFSLRLAVLWPLAPRVSRTNGVP